MASTQAVTQVVNWDFETKLKGTFEFALPKLGPDAAQELKQMISPESIGIMAGVLIVWVVAQGLAWASLLML